MPVRSLRTLGTVVAVVAILSACMLPDLGGLTGANASDAGVVPDGGNPDAPPGTDAGGDAAKPDGGPTCPPYVLPAQCDAKYLSDGKNCCIAGRDCRGERASTAGVRP